MIMRTLLLAPLLALCAAATLGAQELPGVRATLLAPSIVPARGDVQLRLVLQVDKDTEVPAQLLTGLDLTVRVDGQDRGAVTEAGRGGPVALNAGTRVDRILRVPVDRLLPTAGGGGEVRLVALGWKDMIGVDCTFKIAPDTADVRIEDLDLAKTQVVLVTNMGDMTLEFRPDKAPNHVENFVKLCLQGFYDGTKFHRVIKDFMIQGGDPLTKDDTLREQWGGGGPGYSIDAEFNDLRHLKGTLSMARTSDPNSAGSGFFICHRDAPQLDGKYSAFGNLVAGVDTLERIANQPVAGPLHTPVQPVVLQAAVVLPVKRH